MAMIPETKDWTWVLQCPCPECGLDTRSFTREDIPAIIGANAAGWQQALTASADPAARPTPGKWSPVEYACHVRDLLVLCDYRLGLMLTQDDPLFANWDQDEAAVTGRYGEQVPTEVATQIKDAAATAASRFAEVAGDQWLRKGRRSDGVRFTVETFGRNLVHEAVHHLYDVTAVRHGDPHRS
jgi:hypothetical protein